MDYYILFKQYKVIERITNIKRRFKRIRSPNYKMWCMEDNSNKLNSNYRYFKD